MKRAPNGKVTGDQLRKKKNKDVITKQLTKRVLYSDKNTNAKRAPLYSVLYPDTNSLSLSEKSKGARWDSARVQNNQIKNKYEIAEDLNIKILLIL